MHITFEDSKSTQFSLSAKHPFYCFYNSTMNNDLPVAPHWHYYVEILIVTTGFGQLIINGRSMVLNTGDLVYILPQDVHSISGISTNDFEYAVIKFDPKILFDSTYDAFIFTNIIPIISPIDPLYKYFPHSILPSQKTGKVLNTVKTFQEKPYGYEFQIKSNLMQLFYEFINHINNQGINLLEHSLQNVDFTSILPAFTYIEEHFDKPITAYTAANHCHLSYSYFSRLFKKISGITFTMYLNFVRITEAERLLINHAQSITDIGFQVGYMDTSYFIRQFKNFKGITPKQFVKLIEKEV